MVAPQPPGVVTLLLIGFIGGIIPLGRLQYRHEKANTEEFCISRHEMRNTQCARSRKPSVTTTVAAFVPPVPTAMCRMSGAEDDPLVRSKPVKSVCEGIWADRYRSKKFEAHRLDNGTNEWRRMKRQQLAGMPHRWLLRLYGSDRAKGVAAKNARSGGKRWTDLYRLPQA